MSYNKVLVLNMGFDKKSPKYTNEHWVYFPDKSLNFYRVGFYDNILKTDKLNVYVEIGYSKDDIINLDEQIELTLNGMNRVGIINDSMKLVDKSIVIMDPAYVHISEDTEDELNKIQRDLASQQVFTIGRYGKWTYCSMEDCMIWSKELYDKIKNTSN
jgi:protoporphyrinogen oxidase